MEFIKTILEGKVDEETLNALLAEFPKHAIPKAKFNEVNDELKAQKELAEKNNTTITELTNKAKTAEEKDQIIAAMKQENETFKAETEKRIQNTNKMAALQLQLAGEVDSAAVDLVAGLIDLEKVTIDGGKVTNYEDLVKPIKESRSTLFKQVDVGGGTPPGGKPPGGKSIAEMSDEEYFTSIGLKPVL